MPPPNETTWSDCILTPVAVPEPKMGCVSHSEVTAEDKYTPKDRLLKAQKSYFEREGAVLLITKARKPTVIHEINEYKFEKHSSQEPTQTSTF